LQLLLLLAVESIVELTDDFGRPNVEILF